MALYPISRRVSLFFPMDVAELVAAYARMSDYDAMREVLAAPLWIHAPGGSTSTNAPALEIKRLGPLSAMVTVTRDGKRESYGNSLRMYELLVFADRAAHEGELWLSKHVREEIGDDALALRAGRMLQKEIDAVAIAAPVCRKRVRVAI